MSDNNKMTSRKNEGYVSKRRLPKTFNTAAEAVK